MTWLDKQDPIIEKKLGYLRAMLSHEIDLMTEEQLAVAIVLARASRHGDPRAIAILEEAAGDG